MSVKLDWSLKDDGASAALARLVSLPEDLTPLMDEIGRILGQSAADRIEISNVGPDGAAWVQSRRAREEGTRTLHKTGVLAGSIRHQPSRHGVEVGSHIEYAAIHQFGGTIRPKTARALAIPLPGGGVAFVGKVEMPARPYLGVSDQDAADIDSAIIKHLRAVLEGGAS